MVKQQNKIVFKKIVLLIFALMFVLSNASVANAAVKQEDEINPLFTTISAYTIRFNISGITATCTASLYPEKSTNLSIKMELQKKKSGTYSTVKTWTASKTGLSLAISEKRNINILYEYRLKATFTAGTEKVVAYKY